MTTLLLLRGAPGSGKTYWREKAGLTPYTICADEIRLLLETPQHKPDGSLGISQANERATWDFIYSILEKRMSRGEFTVIDATHSKTNDFSNYKKLIEKYRYRVMCLDLTHVPLDTCLKQSQQRPNYKHVPESYIRMSYERFKGQAPPNWVKILPREVADDPTQIVNHLIYTPTDHTSNYETMIIIGDIHGSLTPLKALDPTDPNILYVFTGDYFDRGSENLETFVYLNDLRTKPNTIFLRGNHEDHLWNWANDLEVRSTDFNFTTRLEFEKGNISKPAAREFYRGLSQIAYIKFHGNTYFISHGGIARHLTPHEIFLTATRQFIKGVGRYSDDAKIAETWNAMSPPNAYQAHGHRNESKLPVINGRTFNLEQKGYLRAVMIYKDTIQAIEIKDTTKHPYRNSHTPPPIPNNTPNTSDIQRLVQTLSRDRDIKKKYFGDIVSFNFSRETFRKKRWTENTITARGLFINPSQDKIVARGYPKFFNVEENQHTSLSTLATNLKFPLEVYYKENGFLGLIGDTDPYTDPPTYFTKSTPVGPYSEIFRSLANDLPNPEVLHQYARENESTLIFEVVDTKNDPHIIEYPSNRDGLYLLDVIKNQIEPEYAPYELLQDLAQKAGCKIKTPYPRSLDTWEEFLTFYQEVSDPKYAPPIPIEGVVTRDQNGMMAKIKLEYYWFWRNLRHVIEIVNQGGHRHPTGSLTSAEANFVYNWFISLPKVEQLKITDVLTLRKRILAEAQIPLEYQGLIR